MYIYIIYTYSSIDDSCDVSDVYYLFNILLIINLLHLLTC